MRCIHRQSPGLLSLPHLKSKSRLKIPKHLWLSNRLLHTQSISCPRIRPISSTVSHVLRFDSPANAGDVSVFIQTGAVLFFAYWLANFVVPGIIAKYLQLDKEDESEKPNVNNPFEDEKRSR